MKRSKELAVCGMLTALAIILSIVERMFPLDAIIPIPGVKLGLANVVTLFALTRLGLRDSLAVVVVRVTLASLLMGSVTAFLFSLFGGLLALFAMWALLLAVGKFCSLLGVPEATDEEIDRARARIERKRRKDQLASGLCAIIMIIATIAGLVMLFVPEYRTPYFWLAWAIGGLLCAVAAIAVGSFVKDQPSQ